MRKIIFIAISWILSLELNAKMYAVVVGINQYSDSRACPTLNYSVSDATAFYNYLNGVTSNKNNLEITYLTNTDATYLNITSAIQFIASKATEKDRILLYFSGHGCPGAFCTFDCRSDGTYFLTFDFIKTHFNASKAKVKYIFADACNSGSLKKSPSYSDNLSNSKVMVFLSSRFSEYSQEKGYYGNGVFTQNLLDALTSSAADANKDKRITVSEMFNYVRKKTFEMTKGEQNPIIYGNFNKLSVIGTYK